MYRHDSRNVHLCDGMPSQRSGHASFAYGSDVYIVGGYKVSNAHEKYTNILNLWVYNVEMNVWMKTRTDGDILQGISGATICVINDTAYLFGGHYRYENSSSIFALRRTEEGGLRWEEIEAASDFIPSPRDKHSAWEWKEKMYVFGGYGPPFDTYPSSPKQLGDFHPDFSEETLHSYLRGWNNQVAVFDPSTFEWHQPQCRGCPPAPRAAHASVRLGSKVYIFGGRTRACRQNDLHCLDLETFTWSGELQPNSPAPCGRSWHTMCRVSDNLIFLFGGFTEEQQPLGDSWLLDVSKVLWVRLCYIPDKCRLWHTISVTDDGDILVFGGCANNILRRGEVNEHTNSLLHFRFSPPSLKRLCLDVAYTRRNLLEPSWSSLPRELHKHLLARKQAQLDLTAHFPEPFTEPPQPFTEPPRQSANWS